MANFDAETMKKQHFWLLLIPGTLGLLLAWIGLLGVSGATEEKAKQNEDAKKKLETAKAQSKEILKLYDGRRNVLFDLRTQRWKEMWELQQDIYEWPKVLGDDEIAKVKGKKFGDQISDSTFLSVFRDLYAKEYETVASDAAPMQFANGWQTVLRHVPKWTRNPESEDVWLAIEDYWLQKELVRALAEINSKAGKFELVQVEKDNPRSRTFRNRIWQVELQLVDRPNGVAIEGTIRNLTDRLQAFNATNELVLEVGISSDSAAPKFRFAIEGNSLEGGKQEKIKFVEKKHLVLGTSPQGIFDVKQVYDVRTAPVKRLDALEMGNKPTRAGLSARHSQVELQMAAFSTKAMEADAGAAPATSGPPGGGISPSGPPMGGGNLGGPPPGPGRSGAGPSAGEQAATGSDSTFNGLPRRRYIARTDQVRSVPIGLTVIADQAFVQDVLTAVANCKLRFQTVQTHLIRFRGSLTYTAGSSGGGSPDGEGGAPSLRPPAGASTGGPGAGGPPGPTTPPPPMKIGPPMGPVAPSGPGFPGFPGGSGSAPRSSNEDQVASNLIELNIYGIATLYEKFDVVKKDEASTATESAPLVPPKKENDPANPPKGEFPITPPKGDTPPKGEGAPKDAVPTPPKS
jgi:hypothetical protein